MTAAILFGRKGSTGLPGKNMMPVLGRPCCEYPLIAASTAASIDRIYVSTDDPDIAEVGSWYGAEYIERPTGIRGNKPLEDVIVHACREVSARIGTPDVFVLLQANAPCVSAETIDRAVGKLRSNTWMDSVASVAEMAGFAPYRARWLDGDTIVPATNGNAAAKGDRAGNQAVLFCDSGAYAVRPSVIDGMDDNPGPYRWQGRTIGYVLQEPSSGDIDFPWQIPVAEWWLRRRGHE